MSHNTVDEDASDVTSPSFHSHLSLFFYKPSTVSNSVSKKMGRPTSHNTVDEDASDVTSPDTVVVNQPEDVLVVTFGNLLNDCPGMIPEHKVDARKYMERRRSVTVNQKGPDLAKRSRFNCKIVT